MRARFGSFLVVVAVAVSPVLAEAPSETEALRIDRAIAAALAPHHDPVQQARALCRLAWPSEGTRDEAVAASARRALETFGTRYMYALQEAMNVVPQEYTEEVVHTLLIQQQGGIPIDMPELVPTLLDTLWVGSRAAKVRAINALYMFRPVLAVPPMIDSALDDPALAQLVVATLGTFRYEQARFWLEKMMVEGPPELRASAATSLAQIGGAALGPLKNGLKAPDRELRLLAARSLLAAATEYELGAIYEYLETYADDDPVLTNSLRITADKFEKQIAARDAAEAASAPKDF